MKFNVSPQKQAELLARMTRCGIREEDIEEKFVRSSGPGGQHVNRSATCVHLLHKPSGLEVKMQRERSQSLNRFLARRRLCELMEERLFGKQSSLHQRIEKLRKQKARRKRRAVKREQDSSR
ncbi:MAG TPA: peptide chain release factor-like protein [Candidatus Hydrogenedentes bacterium]|nr:peptide chain release factor-like protein [Candidatus Hydrogenedentota bacterium]